MTNKLELPCLPLDSARWSELEHAYGKAADMPALLAQLDTLPSSANEQEPWFSLWSALAHQHEVYSASFAAVPHVVRALATSPLSADASYFQFPAMVEAWRQEQGMAVPADLNAAYQAALAALPGLVAAAAPRAWDAEFLACALSAVAAAKGYGSIATAVLELSPKLAEEFMDWLDAR